MARPLVAGMFLALLVQAAAYAGPDSGEAFYRGKVLTLFVGYGPGGGYDLVARVLARHLGSHIAGNPTIVVQNMPGAGSLVAANYLYNVAARDGTQFGLIARDMPLIGLLGHNPNVRFDPHKFTWIGSASDFSDDAYVLIVRKDAPIKSIDDARRSDGPVLVLGGTAEGASSADVPKILRDTLGLHLKQILGYRDSAAIFLAMENAELNGRMAELSSVRATHPQWLEPDSDYRILVMYGRTKRDPEFPDVPTARELAPDKAARDLIEFTEAPLLSMAWPFAAPPGLLQDRAAVLQSAFAATAHDPDYVADAAAVKIAVSPVSAGEIYRAIDKLSAASPAILDYVRNLMNAGKGG